MKMDAEYFLLLLWRIEMTSIEASRSGSLKSFKLDCRRLNLGVNWLGMEARKRGSGEVVIVPFGT